MAIQPIYYALGKQNIVVTDAAQQARSEELIAAYERIAELDAMLDEARLQLEYLHEKFDPTGTTETILARIDAVIS